jgi:anti-sigma factor RsiW
MLTVEPREVVCREVLDLVTAYLEDALTVDARARLDHHLERCPVCRTYLEQIKATSRIVGQITPDDMSPAMLDALIGLFRDWQANEKRPSSGDEQRRPLRSA